MVRVGLKVGARVRVGGKVRFFYMGVGLGFTAQRNDSALLCNYTSRGVCMGRARVR